MGVPTYFPLIHNQWVKTSKAVKVVNPYTNKTVAKVYQAEGDFLDMAVESAKKGLYESKNLSTNDRYTFLMKIAQEIGNKQNEIAKTIVSEAGKPIRFARNEVTRAQLTFSWAAEESRRLTGDFIPLDVAPQTRGYYGISHRFPLGIILGISPFNFPLNLVAHKVAPAIASGNSIILKPTSQTPVTAVLLGEIIKNTGLPPGIVNIVPTRGKNAETLVKDGRINKLSFTGSAKIGWYLKSIAGKKHVTLELGGNAAAIVEPDVQLEEVIPRLVLGSFAYAGQVCIAVQRIYIQKKIFNKFIQLFIDRTVKSAIYGDPSSEKTMVGPMINTDAAKKAEGWINEASKGGAKILIGGKRHDNILEPTVLTHTQPEMKAVCEEIFAPVVIIEPYDQFEDAIRFVNNSYYGLQTGLFTNDLKKVQTAYKELDVGGLIINDYPMFRIDPMPYGGTKDSGFGREGIRYAIEEMTEIKLLVLKT